MEKYCQNLPPKNAFFECILCDFKCSKNSDWSRHINTNKHISRLKGNVQKQMEMKKNAEYACNCGKRYISYSGLWKHNKICKSINHDITNDYKEDKKDYKFDKNFKITPEMFYDLLKQNNELQKS